MVKRRRTAGNPKVAIAYLRVSTDKQEHGPEVQRADILRFARQQGAEVVEFFCDKDVSGGDELNDRPGLMRALDAVTKYGAGELIVQKRDRLARDTYVAATLQRAVASAGARIVSTEGSNGDAPSDKLMRTMLDAFAAHERDMIKARTKAALAVKSERGERVGCLPYGMQVAADGVHLEPCPAEQHVIETARALRAEGRTLEGIIEELEVLGLSNRKGKPFGLAAMHKLLK